MLFRVILILIVYFPVASFAQNWTVTKAPDETLAKTAARVVNNRGDTLYIWRKAKQNPIEVYAELHLGGGQTFATFKLPKFQVDEDIPMRVDRIKTADGISHKGFARISQEQVLWKVWESKNNMIKKGDGLDAWLNGERIRFIYFDGNAQEQTTDFSLSGSGRKITKISGLSLPQ